MNKNFNFNIYFFFHFAHFFSTCFTSKYNTFSSFFFPELNGFPV